MLDYLRRQSKEGAMVKSADFARLAAAALAGISLHCAAAETTLKLVSVFPSNHTFNIPVHEMIKSVNAKGKGVLQMQFIGGPEVVPPTEQLAALQRGVFDLFAGAASYY